MTRNFNGLNNNSFSNYYARLLTSNNIDNIPYAEASKQSNIAQQNLQSAQTTGGTLANSIAYYIAKKREAKELQKLQDAERQNNFNKEIRVYDYIQSLPEDQRMAANALDTDTLQKFALEDLENNFTDAGYGKVPATLKIANAYEDALNKGDFARANNIAKFSKIETSNTKQNTRPQIAPSGYRFTEDNNLEAIAGGPAVKQSAEGAGKIALIKQGLNDIEDFEKLLKDENNSFNRFKIAGLRTYGRVGARDEYSKLFNALNARLRLESGAAVPESEVKRAFETFAPNPLDSDETINSKITRLKQFFESAQQEIAQGRGGEPIKYTNNINQNNDPLGLFSK